MVTSTGTALSTFSLQMQCDQRPHAPTEPGSYPFTRPHGSSWPSLPCAGITGGSCYICLPLSTSTSSWVPEKQNSVHYACPTITFPEATLQPGNYPPSSSLKLKPMQHQRANAPLYITCWFVVLTQCTVSQLQEYGWKTCLEWLLCLGTDREACLFKEKDIHWDSIPSYL